MTSAHHPAAALDRMRAARRTRILQLAVVICLTDLVNGAVAPTFTLYARGLGASLALVGALTAVVGLTRLVTALPAGMLADRLGRRGVIVSGIALFGVACGLFTVSRDPRFLIVPRILFGVAMVSTFSIGVAFIADRTHGRSRDLAIGAYVSAQGAGYALGPLAAGLLATQISTEGIYRLMAVLAIGTAAYAWTALDSPTPRGAPDEPEPSTKLLAAARALPRAGLVGVSVANLVMILMFSGTVVPFLALVGTRLGLGHSAIALLYGARATTSTITRLPAGALARRLSNAHLLLLAVAIDAIAAALIGFAEAVPILVAAVVVDGIAFGTFLAASQSFVVETVQRRYVGAALGIYSMAGSIGEAAGAAIMGAIAATLGAAAVFRLDSLVLLAGLAASALAIARHHQRYDPRFDDALR